VYRRRILITSSPETVDLLPGVPAQFIAADEAYRLLKMWIERHVHAMTFAVFVVYGLFAGLCPRPAS